jgi:hypothetical protein
VRTELGCSSLGTANRKGRTRISLTCRHRVTSRLYRVAPILGPDASTWTAAIKRADRAQGVPIPRQRHGRAVLALHPASTLNWATEQSR